MIRFYLLLISIILSSSSYLYAEDNQKLEQALISAITLNKITKERQKDAGKMIRLFIKDKYVARKPESRDGYTDYRVLRKPISFLGHQLLVIQEEYMSKWVGCCVSPGLGIVVKTKGDYSKLKSFAIFNGCNLIDNQDVTIFPKYPFFKLNSGEKYIELACKERDIPDYFWTSSDKTVYSIEEFLSVLRQGGKDILLTSTSSPFIEIDLKENCIATSQQLGKGVWGRLKSGFQIKFPHKIITFENNEVNNKLGCLKSLGITSKKNDLIQKRNPISPSQSDWVFIGRSENHVLFEAKPSSLEITTTKGGVPIAVIVGQVTGGKTKSIDFYQWYVSLNDCRREMGKLVALDTDGAFNFDSDFVIGGSSMASTIASLVCGAYTYNKDKVDNRGK